MGKHMKVRLPFEYNLKAQKKAAFDAAAEVKARKMFKQYDRYTVDIVICSVALVMIRVFGWGSGNRATRVNRLIDEVRKTIEYYCERYGYDCAMTAILRDLAEYGVEYEGRNE